MVYAMKMLLVIEKPAQRYSYLAGKVLCRKTIKLNAQ